MRAILGTIAALWAVVLGVVILLVVLRKDEDPSAAARPAAPFSCQSLERRAKECQPQLLEAVEAFLLEKHRQSKGESYGSARRVLIQSFVQGEIEGGKVAHYCEKYLGHRAPRIERLVRGVKRCYTQPGCRAFARCLRELAAQANLPL